jgi:hypothetical protein
MPSGRQLPDASRSGPLETARYLVSLAVPVAGAIIASASGHAGWAGALVGGLAGLLLFGSWPRSNPPAASSSAGEDPPVPEAPPRPPSRGTVDDGLLALARGRREDAASHWRNLVREGSRDPEPYLFLSLLYRRARDWSRFDEAIGLSRKACELDPRWPDAWLSIGEWHLLRALEEGQRRVQGSKTLFRLDDMLREMGTWDVVLESYGKAAELDTGRLRGELASVASKFFDKTAPLRIFEKAGEKGDQAAVRSVPDLLRRAGIPPSDVRPTPSDADALRDIESLRKDGRAVVLIPNESRILDWRELLAAAGLPHEPALGFRGAQEHDAWYRELLRARFGILTPWAAALPFDWREGAVPVSILWMAAEDLSLHQFLGCVSSTGVDPGSRMERRWYVAKLLSRRGAC